VADAPDVDDVFTAALEREAASAPPEVPAPPRLAPSADPDAPHGRAEDGTPNAPFGLNKKTGRPNLKAAGPGRGGRKADAPRTTTMVPADPKKTAAGVTDYRADLAGLGQTVWMAGAMLPPARPYAALWMEALPGLIESWNTAAQKNGTVRGYVEKLAGDGSYAWVIGVTVATLPFVVGCAKLSRKEKDPVKAKAQDELKAALKSRTEDEFAAYVQSQMGVAEVAAQQAA